MKTNLLPSVKLTFLFIMLFMGIYSLSVFVIAQAFPNNGKGKIIENAGKRYYENIAQKFTRDEYFWARPSAVNYNAAGSGGSNKGPSNPDYLSTVQSRIDTFLVHNPNISRAEIPSDLVTASGSGQDPNISVQGALIQIPRIAKSRKIGSEQLRQLVVLNTEKPWLGIMGPEKVNVLELNIALDNLK